MKMLLHHQKRRNFSDGTFINIGEDGYPYADGKLLIVADGLGGRGGYPHTKIDPDILNREAFYYKFIEPVIGSADQGYVRFVTDSFHELFELKGRYFTGSATMRTSGYFASRLVTAIVLYELKYSHKFQHGVIFDNLNKLYGEAQKQYINDVRNNLAIIIKQKLTCLASRMGLELESKTTGSYLLPTTLTVALINETEDGVDVLYLWAGDSRGYLWNGDGLAQVTDDHECDETMTNLITLTKPFRLEARFIKVNKPAILFNATDGCYKCPCFASAFDLEYVFLQAVSSSDNFVETAENLDKQFTTIGTHDDSNTMALSTFGYESFEAIKMAVAQRLSYLQENIISELPDILERDYVEELNQIDEQMEGSIFAVKDVLIAIEPIAEFVKQKMVDDSYAPYTQELTLLNQKLADLDKEKELQQKNIAEWVRYYWLRKPCLKKLTIANKNFDRGDTYEKFIQMETECGEERQRYVTAYTKILEDLNKSIEAVLSMQGSILNLEAFKNKEIREELSSSIETSCTLLEKIKNLIVKGKIEKTFSRYFKRNEDFNSLTNRYLKLDSAIISSFVQQIYNGWFHIGDIEMSQECRLAIKSYLDTLQNIAAIRQKTLEEIKGLHDKYLMSYWNDCVYDLILIIRRDVPELIPEEIKSRIADNIGDLQLKRDEIVHCLELRNRLYEFYNQSYYRLFEESSL